MGNRHKAREFALQILYAIDISENQPEKVVSLFWETLTCQEEVRLFSNELVMGVCRHMALVDEIISRYSEHWAIERMTSVDRNILRMAVYELLCLPEIPHSVTINEAVEIGKKFGSEDSGAFVNGILDKIAKEIQEQQPQKMMESIANELNIARELALIPIEEKFDVIAAGQAPAVPEINGNENGTNGANGENGERQKIRRAAIAKAAMKKKLPVGAKITIRKGE
jgi:transcription antitermination protein NusB